jgi:hypothetical protein
MAISNMLNNLSTFEEKEEGKFLNKTNKLLDIVQRPENETPRWDRQSKQRCHNAIQSLR